MKLSTCAELLERGLRALETASTTEDLDTCERHTQAVNDVLQILTARAP